MTKIYLAGPLFNEAERTYNSRLKMELADHGYELSLPQDNSMKLNVKRMLTDQDYRDAAVMMVFQADLEMLESCEALLINLDGRAPDEGACVELGYAYAKGKPCFAIKTDVRSAEYGTDNMMISGAVRLRTASCMGDLVRMMKEEGL